jgi:PAS domain S-box-containing protein
MGTLDTNQTSTKSGLNYLLGNSFLKKIQAIPYLQTSFLRKYYNKVMHYFTGNEAIFIDADGTILNWNKSYEQLQGYKEKEIVGQSMGLFYLPQDRQSQLPQKLIQLARKHGNAIYKGKWVRKDGTTFFGCMFLKAVHGFNNEVIGFMEVLRELRDGDSD